MLQTCGQKRLSSVIHEESTDNLSVTEHTITLHHAVGCGGRVRCVDMAVVRGPHSIRADHQVRARLVELKFEVGQEGDRLYHVYTRVQQKV